MEIPFSNKKIVIGLTIVLLILMLVYYYFIAKKNPATSPTNISVSPTNNSEILLTVDLKNLNDAPTLAPANGGGLDTSSSILKESASNIEKIMPKLPYANKITSQDGIEIEIRIPRAQYQENRWTLLVYIFGINYQEPESSPEYAKMRNAFREGAADVLHFIETSGADPEQIIIQWGDRRIVENRAIEWLK